MFGTPLRSLRRPVLLIVVFGFFLMIVGLTALSQAIVVSTQSSQTMLSAIVGSDAATVRGFVNGYLPPGRPRARRLVRDARRQPSRRSSRRSTPPERSCASKSGRPMARSSCRTRPARRCARRGVARLHGRGRRNGHGRVPSGRRCRVASALALPANDVLRAYFPVKFDGKVVAVVGIWRDAAPILGDLDQLRRQVMIVTLFAGALAAVALYLVFRAAQRRILRQTDELLEATRLDQLTGTLNHGALVGVLAVAIEAARQARRDPRDRAPRHRQLPEPQPDLRPSGRRRGTDRCRRAASRRASRRRRAGGATDPTNSWSSSPPTRRRPGADDRTRPDAARRPQPAIRRRPNACRSRSVPGSAPSRSMASR